MKYDVFISYARDDYENKQTREIIPGNIVSRIKQLLNDNELKYWFDEEGIYSGDQFAGVIADAIEHSMIFLYISTEASNASKWTINEIATAKHLDKKIIPFRYDYSKYNKSILMYLAPLDHIEYPKNKEKAFVLLITSIKTYKQSIERAETEKRNAAEQAKLHEQEKLEKQKKELERQLRIREIKTQLETISYEISKKQQEQASINIILNGLEKQHANLNKELTLLTSMSSSFNQIKEDAVYNWKIKLTSIWKTKKIFLAIIVAFIIFNGIIISLFSTKYTPEEMFQKGRTYNDLKKAIGWYRKAAKQGHAEAQCHMGFYSIQGIGIDCDTIQALEWYRKAAEQGHIEAKLKLGDCYKNGYGVSQDYDKALKHYQEVYGDDYAFFNVMLNNNWEHCSGVANLDSIQYNAYQSFSNKGKHNSSATMYIDIIGYDTFIFYAHASSEYTDYVYIEPNPGNPSINGNSKNNCIDNYQLIKYKNLGGKKVRIKITFKKDYSGNYHDDRGYIIIPQNQPGTV